MTKEENSTESEAADKDDEVDIDNEEPNSRDDDNVENIFETIQNAHDWLCSHDKNHPAIIFLLIATKLKDMGTRELLEFLSKAKIDIPDLLKALYGDDPPKNDKEDVTD